MPSTVSRSEQTTETLFHHYNYLVNRIISPYRRLFRGPDWDDVVSDANVGLVRAIYQYDPTRCEHFESFARCRIRQTVQEGLRRRDISSRYRRINKKHSRRTVTIEAADLATEPIFQYIEKAYDSIENTECVAVLLSGLDDASQALIHMKFYEDLDMDTIAERTGMTRRSVYRKLNKILKGLKDSYDRHAG
ncbi:MAG: sigma-70 family RNA polymerase sigma factor [Phycisphaerae bacterium]|jgi:RNA polymerase sigma factor (sigma-70 family)|nr:sigma-70 family RNA polymerase sigma factor [Phycisphaerae bacterium]